MNALVVSINTSPDEKKWPLYIVMMNAILSLVLRSAIASDVGDAQQRLLVGGAAFALLIQPSARLAHRLHPCAETQHITLQCPSALATVVHTTHPPARTDGA